MEELTRESGKRERLLWMDVLRGLLILSVVVGHATGRFNGYIYQFHMGAFFLVSGYMAHQERRSVLHTLYHRLLTTVLPVITAAMLLLGVTSAMNAAGVYSLLFGENFPYMGVVFTLKGLFFHGSLYVWWLGACWFILALFGASILNRLLFQICGKRGDVLYLAGLASLFLLGYSAAASGPHRYDWDLVLISSFYYGLGVLASKHFVLERLAKQKVVCLTGLVVTGGVAYLVAHRFALTMDWPSRAFNFSAADCFTVLNGLAFVFFLSVFLKELPVIRLVLSYLGKNTLPIVLFHFIWFNLGFYLLYLAGKIPFSYLQDFTPPEDISYTWWWLFVIVGIGGSVLLWEGIRRCKLLRIVFGQEKILYARGWQRLCAHASWAGADAALDRSLNWLSTERLSAVKRKILAHPILAILLFVFLLLVLIPWYREGIICNDELQARLLSLQGFHATYQSIFSSYHRMGRMLAAPVNALTTYLGFLGQSNWSFKLVQILVILLTIWAFCALLYRFFASKTFSLLSGMTLVAFLPISFEHTEPNAFVTLFPIGLIFLSMCLYWDWLGNRKKGVLTGSLLLLAVTLCSYEAFVTLIPVYVFLSLYRDGWKGTLRRWKDLLWPVGAGVMYLAAYVVAGRLAPSQYAGNQLILPNPLNALKIILHLMRSSFPGFYVTNRKYQYLWQVYRDLTLDDVVRATLVCGIFVAVMFLLCRQAGASKQPRHSGWIVFCTLGIVALPTLPIAMAQMYQTAIGGDNGFLALPVTFFSFFPAVFLCCFVCWEICRRVSHRAVPWAVTLCTLLILVPTQLMNGEFAERHEENFQRLETMETMVKSPVMQNMGGATVCTTDLFQTRNALAIHDSYWTDYAAVCGETVQIVNQEGRAADNRIYFDDTRFYIWSGDELCVLSSEPLSGYSAAPYLSDTYLTVDYSGGYRDGNWYTCYFSYVDGALTPGTPEVFSATQQHLSVGQTLATCVKNSGYSEDGWLAKDSSFQIRSGDTGVLRITLYQPKESYQSMQGTITVNNEAHEFALSGETTVLELPVEADAVLDVSISMAQEFEAGGGDIRMLSVLLSDMEGL